MGFILDIIKGIAIGIGTVAPGVSGGALAVIFGIYENLTSAIANIFTDFRRKVLYLLPLGIGGGIGVLAFSRVMNFLFSHYEIEVKYLFIGLMAGTLPLAFKQANKRGFKRSYIIPFVLAVGITVLFAILEGRAVSFVSKGEPGLLLLALYGAIIGFGTIIPGISASFILMYLGVYQFLMEGLSNLDLTVIVPVGAGIGLSIILFAKLINLLFSKVYGYTYYSVLGFVAGSIAAIFPGIEFDLKYVFCLLLLAIGFILSYNLSMTAKDRA